MENKDFEKYLNKIDFDDKPDYAHRDQLEKKLLASLASLAQKESGMKLRFSRYISKFAAAAVIIIGVLIGITNFTGTNVWAQVISAFNKVENVHVTQIASMADGTVQKQELWIRMPECFYEDNFLKTTIDNGTDRLVIDKQKKTAQFSDSFIPYKSIAEQSIFEQLSIFRNENQDEIKYKKLSDESTKDTIVFRVQYGNPTKAFDGKAWVDAVTMLPLRVEVDFKGESSAGDAIKGEIICNYDPIPDTVFATIIPDGYREVPREKTGIISGKVIDEKNNVVDNAIVCIADKSLSFTTHTRTNTSGEFSFKTPPQGTGKIVVLPVFIRAFREDDPNRVAWTIITDPNKADPRSVRVPGEAGKMKCDGTLLKEASEIVLKMEPAGTIFGFVTDTQNKPVRNATVTARSYPAYKSGGGSDNNLFTLSLAGQGVQGKVQVQTDSSGRYEFHNLPRFWDRSDYILEAEAIGYDKDQIQFDLNGELTVHQVDLKLVKKEADNNKIAVKDTQSLKSHLSDKELIEYYKAHPLEENQMDFRKGQETGNGYTIGSIQGLDGYKIWRIGSKVDFFAKTYPEVPSSGRMRYEGDFNDVYLQYDIVGRGDIPTQKYVAETLSRVGIEIVESEDTCTVWIAEYNGQKLKNPPSIKIPYPNAPAGVPGSAAALGWSFKIKNLLNNLAQQQDIVVEDKTGIGVEIELTWEVPNFKTQVGADLAKEWFKENFGITFKIEQRRMKVWVVRKKAL
jgi:hypothetical protein